MIDDPTGLVEATPRRERVFGRHVGDRGGPTLIVMTGLHGNETAGGAAARRVLDALERQRPAVRGRFVCLAGNLRALHERTRFIDADLNRQWTAGRVKELTAGRVTKPAAEDEEQLALIAAIRDEVGSASGPFYFLDLHTSSAPGPPFLTVGDTLRNRNFASRFPLPIILGLEEQIDGSLLEFLSNYGFVTLGVEAGQHIAPESVDRHEALLWLALVAAGILDDADLNDAAGIRARLWAAGAGIPRVIEVRHRHAITAQDEFRMEPGFSNFQRVAKGRELGRDRHGPVLAAESGLILLPLYQGKGDDGFFIAREVRPFWLAVSAALRRLRLGGVIRWLPGVRQDGDAPESFAADTRIARFYPLEVFHLLGFRKQRKSGARLVVSRRRHDLKPPRQIDFP